MFILFYLQEAISSTNVKTLPEHQNPLLLKLDNTLQEIKVRRQAYYSNTFVGNHVNKCLQVRYISRMSIIKRKALTNNLISYQLLVQLHFRKWISPKWPVQSFRKPNICVRCKYIKLKWLQTSSLNYSVFLPTATMCTIKQAS